LAGVEGDCADALLSELLRDSDDTAVAEAALDVLIGRGDQKGAALIFEAVATADDDLVDHLLYFLASREPRLRASGFIARARSGLAASDTEVQEGAREVMKHLGWRSESLREGSAEADISDWPWP
jgi:hypothetical protein